MVYSYEPTRGTRAEADKFDDIQKERVGERERETEEDKDKSNDKWKVLGLGE